MLLRTLVAVTISHENPGLNRHLKQRFSPSPEGSGKEVSMGDYVRDVFLELVGTAPSSRSPAALPHLTGLPHRSPAALQCTFQGLAEPTADIAWLCAVLL